MNAIYIIGDIAHWGSASDVYGLFEPRRDEGIHVTVKLNQQFLVTDIHKDNIGVYYEGWINHNDTPLYLEQVRQSRLVDKDAWERSLPAHREHPNLYPAVRQDYTSTASMPAAKGQLYVLTRTISGDGQEDHTVLGSSSDATLLRVLMSQDLLTEEQTGDIARNRFSNLRLCPGVALGQFHLSWSAVWGKDQSACYTIEAAPLLTASCVVLAHGECAIDLEELFYDTAARFDSCLNISCQRCAYFAPLGLNVSSYLPDYVYAEMDWCDACGRLGFDRGRTYALYRLFQRWSRRHQGKHFPVREHSSAIYEYLKAEQAAMPSSTPAPLKGGHGEVECAAWLGHGTNVNIPLLKYREGEQSNVRKPE